MKERKNLKGFTLLELILVMAIFGILMAAVMSIITPLNKLSRKASIQEANSSAVDNIKNYFESSLRYADCIEVFPNGLTDNNGDYFMDTAKYTTLDLRSKFGVIDVAGTKTSVTAEEAAVINFLDNHYTNRVKPNTENKTDPETGRVRLLKIDNNNGGVVTEKEWKFTAGFTYTNYYDADTTFEGTTYHMGDIKKKKDDAGNVVNDIGRVNATIEYVKGDASVINPVYYEDYAFYISPGYNTIETVFTESEIDADTLSRFKKSDDTPDIYYGSLRPVITASGNKYSAFSKDMFSLSVVTYQNDKNGDGDYENRGTATQKDELGNNKKYTAFKSPFALTNVNMSLVNINSDFSKNKGSDNYGPIRCNGTYVEGGIAEQYTPTDLFPDENGNWKYTKITSEQAPKIAERLYVHGVSTESQARVNAAQAAKTDWIDKDYDCIYFIYTLPDFV